MAGTNSPRVNELFGCMKNSYQPERLELFKQTQEESGKSVPTKPRGLRPPTPEEFKDALLETV